MQRAALVCTLCVVTACDDGSESSDNEPIEANAQDTQSTLDDSGTSGGSSADALGCAAEVEEDSTDGASEDVMEAWGAACTQDQDCIDLLGDGGVCLFTAVIYELPQGYCAKTCELPPGTLYSVDDPQCDPNGGVDCVGQAPLFQVCAPQCTDDTQCSRAGYTCRNFPLVGAEGDPTYCLMPDCCEQSCAEE